MEAHTTKEGRAEKPRAISPPKPKTSTLFRWLTCHGSAPAMAKVAQNNSTYASHLNDPYCLVSTYIQAHHHHALAYCN